MRSSHSKWISALGVVVLLVLAFVILPARAQERDLPGFRVIGRHLYDYQGNKVILYGVNKMVIYTDRDGIPAFEEIAKTSANVVRIVWLTEGTAKELDIAITNAYNNDLIPMIDCHDSTGKWELLPLCVDYWVRPDVLDVIKKHERYLLLNIANEAGDGIVPEGMHRAAYTTAIYRMRTAGIHIPLIIDAQGYGQSINDLQLNGPYLIEADPDHNLMFSIHMWWPSEWRGANVAQVVIDEIAESVEMELPLIVGEFASLGPGCVCCIPWETIIEQCYLNEVGYLPWSWGPGNGDCADMDMTGDGYFDSLHDWGKEVALTSPYSIRNIAIRPAWIVEEPPVPTATPAPTPTPLPAPAGLLSIGAPVTASSQESEALPPENAVDGRLNTRWASAYEDGQDLVLDLGSVQPIGKIVLVWETAYGKQYKLYGSDDNSTWTELVHETNSNGGTDEHNLNTQGRYVRFEGIKRATEWGFSLYELWVFSDADAPLPEFGATQEVVAVLDKRPDLVVKAISWSPERAMIGQALTLNALIANEGIGATQGSDAWQVSFNVNGQDVAVSAPISKGLAPGMDLLVSAETTWTPTGAGDFIVMAFADSTDAVDEVRQHNNIYSIAGTVYAGTAMPTVTPRPASTPHPTDVEASAAKATDTGEYVLLPEPEQNTPWRVVLVPVISLLAMIGVVWVLKKRTK